MCRNFDKANTTAAWELNKQLQMRYKSLQDNWSSNGLLTAWETNYKGLEDLAQNN